MSQNNTSDFPQLWDLATAAVHLGMTERAMRARVARRQVPIVRIGRRVYFDRQRLQRWIAQRTESASGELSLVRGFDGESPAIDQFSRSELQKGE